MLSRFSSTSSSKFNLDQELTQDARAHLHHLLDQHVFQHLTTDYLHLTQAYVYEILASGLSPVPITDRLSLPLPSDPLENLLTLHCSCDPMHLEEKFSVDVEALDLIKRCTRITGPSKSEKIWAKGSAFDASFECSLAQPAFSVLTNQAIRDTPKQGVSLASRRLPRSQTENVKQLDIRPVNVTDVEEEPVALEDMLNLKIAVDAPTRQFMKTMYQNNPFSKLTNSKETYISPHVQALFRCSSPPLLIPQPQEVPIFPRSRLPGCSADHFGVRISGLNTMSDLPSLVPGLNAEDEDDLPQQHMVIVNGWQAYTIPSSLPSTPSLHDGSSEVDELFLPSPAPKPPPINDFLNAKMEDTQMPRRTSLGGERVKPKAVGEGQSLHEYVAPFVEAFGGPKVVTSARSSPTLEQTTTTSSMLGQPPTFLHEDVHDTYPYTRANQPDADADDIDWYIKKLHESVPGDAMDIILREQPDDMTYDMMEVPSLPPPNEHPISHIIPVDLPSLVITPREQQTSARDFQVLKPVTGLKSLQIELAWKPFTFEKGVTTDKQLAQVCSIKDNIAPGSLADDEEVMTLLRGTLYFEPALPTTAEDNRRLLQMGKSEKYAAVSAGEFGGVGSGLVLTRQERRRAARLQGHEATRQADEVYVRTTTLRMNKRARQDDGKASHTSPLRPVSRETPIHRAQSDDTGLDRYSPDASTFPRLARGYSSTSDDYSSPPPEGEASYFPACESFDDLFVPLSMDSHIRSAAVSQTLQSVDPAPVPAENLAYNESVLAGLSATSTPTSLCMASVPPVPLTNQLTEAASAHQSLQDFMAMRGKRSKPPPMESLAIIPTDVVAAPLLSDFSTERGVPAELVDRHTLSLPPVRPQSTIIHRYLASMALILNRPLVRSFQSRQHRIHLVERDFLDDADLVLDCNNAALFFPLLSLPSQCDVLKARLDALSWRYEHLYVIFEAYSSIKSSLPGDLAPNPFSPPVIKAVKRLRRDLGISDVYHTKRAETTVHFAFAESVDEAASFVRLTGDLAERRSTAGKWDNRDWLDYDEQEDEPHLAGAEGMNVFAAASILSRVSLQEFLDMTPTQRMEFGYLIGDERITQFNEYIAQRNEYIRSENSSSVDDELSS
ncbi:hypothetical protein BV25DRAFT_1993548 [Artomyces pyxidatus]|uniref:Uncharacterized protein n=1 Tax=Artomyces pyxidatus TaxID=48021 RepID=A0ACB8SUB2_9AGAM|nr:hypothetical protein BV25DRAFT_1993548 [Artomyces pyxidatus]